VKNTLVLISNRAQALLDDKMVQRAAELLWSNGGSVGTPDWLAPGIACELPFDDLRVIGHAPPLLTSLQSITGGGSPGSSWNPMRRGIELDGGRPGNLLCALV